MSDHNEETLKTMRKMRGGGAPICGACGEYHEGPCTQGVPPAEAPSDQERREKMVRAEIDAHINIGRTLTERLALMERRVYRVPGETWESFAVNTDMDRIQAEARVETLEAALRDIVVAFEHEVSTQRCDLESLRRLNAARAALAPSREPE